MKEYTEWEDYIRDCEEEAERQCRECASASGFTYTMADSCEGCELECLGCPFQYHK